MSVTRRGQTGRAARSGSAAGRAGIDNTDIVLVILHQLGGGERSVDVEDVAEAAWKAAPARFSWPRHQQYPDLDAVDVTLRAAKKNQGLVNGSKRAGWILTVAGSARVDQRQQAVHDFLATFGQAGRTANRRERGGADSSTSRRIMALRASAAVLKHREGRDADITVHDFLTYFGINQYMPTKKYQQNQQATENLVRDEPELLELTRVLHHRFGDTYKQQLMQQEARHVAH